MKVTKLQQQSSQEHCKSQGGSLAECRSIEVQKAWSVAIILCAMAIHAWWVSWVSKATVEPQAAPFAVLPFLSCSLHRIIYFFVARLAAIEANDRFSIASGGITIRTRGTCLLCFTASLLTLYFLFAILMIWYCKRNRVNDSCISAFPMRRSSQRMAFFKLQKFLHKRHKRYTLFLCPSELQGREKGRVVLVSNKVHIYYLIIFTVLIRCRKIYNGQFL